MSWQKKETLFSVHKKHFVVLTKERNTIFYAQETPCCLGKRKKHCSLCTRNTLLSWQKNETLFSMDKKHFVVLAKERNTIFYDKKHFVVLAKERNERNTVFCVQETLCCLGKRKKHYFLWTRNTLLSWQKKEMKEMLFSLHKKHFVVSARETENSVSFFCQDNKVSLVHRKQCFFLFLRQQSVSCVKKTVFLSFSETTKCFFCTENSISFFF